MITAPRPQPLHWHIVPVHAVELDQGLLTITEITTMRGRIHRMTVLDREQEHALYDLAVNYDYCGEFWTGCSVNGLPYLYDPTTGYGRVAEHDETNWRHHIPTILIPAPAVPNLLA